MRFQTLEEWLRWQMGLHHREIELGLDRVSAVWKRLWNGPLPCAIVTVGGTNGKGSSVAFLETILLSAGYRVGSFTSPHLVRYNERIRIDGREAEDDIICQAFDAVDRARRDVPLTFFEFGALGAFWLFVQAKPDIAILEVGLGGRLDAVNIIDADVSLITEIGLDHVSWLGETLEDIAREKAGIMRSGRPVVCAAAMPPVTLLDHAQVLGARLYLAGRDFSFEDGDHGWHWQGGCRQLRDLPRPAMEGTYQLFNASAVLMVLMLMEERFPVAEGALRRGLELARAAARYEVIHGPPPTILDVAHNPQAALALVGNLSHMPCQGRTLAVFGMVLDKDVSAVAAIMAPQVDQWYLADLNMARGMPPAELSERLVAASVDPNRISIHPSPAAAYRAAGAAAGEADRILVFGSFYLVGDVMQVVQSDELL